MGPISVSAAYDALVSSSTGLLAIAAVRTIDLRMIVEA